MKYKYQLFFSTCIIIVILGAIPAQIILSSPQFDKTRSKSNMASDHIEKLTGENKEYRPRLMNKGQIIDSDDMTNFQDFQAQPNLLNPNFAIGSQEGTGGGSITINDSLILVDNTNLNTQNAISGGTPTTRTDTFIDPSLTNFTRNTLDFQIQSVTAEEDWRQIENVTNSPDSRLISFYPEITQEIVINESYANITEARLYLRWSDVSDIDGDTPHGNISIFDDNSGEPGTLLSTTILEDKFSGQEETTYDSWKTYTFPDPVSVAKGRYWLVVNDTETNPAVGSWTWYTQRDASTGNASSWGYKSSHGGSWNINDNDPQPDSDLVCAIRILPTDSSYNNELVYSSPDAINMTYSTSFGDYILNSFAFEANNTATHTFITNTSVSFTMQDIGRYEYDSNSIAGVVTYKAENSSINQFVRWNVTFSITSVITSKAIRNRTIWIDGIETNWRGEYIYWNDTLEYNNLDNDVNVTLDGDPSNLYVNGSSTMVVNASTLSENTTWHVLFDAPNYITSFNWLRSSIAVTEANATDILTPEIINRSDTIGGYNLEVYVNNTQGLQVYYNTNRNITDILPDWDINQSSYPEIVNGTYYSQAFWLNTTSNQVGFYTRNITVTIDTTLDIIVPDPAEVILDEESLVVTVHYNATHNSTGMNNANITGVPSWDPTNPVSFTQTGSHGPYSYSFSIVDADHDPGDLINVTIYAELPWHVTRIQNSSDVKVVSNATLSVDIGQDLSLEWRQNQTIEIKYNVTGGNGINESTIEVDGDSTNFYNISNVYYYRFNSTKYSGDGVYLNLNVTASHSDYLTKVSYFNLTITRGLTNISANIGGTPVFNDTASSSVYYANSSADSIPLILRYYHNMTNDNISTIADVTIIPPSGISVASEGAGITPYSSWNVTFDPYEAGDFVISITFNLTNYYNATFIFHLTVSDAHTRIQTDYTNDTEVYYAESFEFTLYYNNTDWNENITFNGQGPITISETSKLQFLNRTDELYWFEFNYNSAVIDVASHSITITFQSIDYFASSSILVRFEVIQSPFVSINGTEIVSGGILINGTSDYGRNYSPNEYDNLTLSFSYFVNKTGQILVIPLNEISISKDSSITNISTPQGNNWTIIFDGSSLGTYLLQITFSHENYTSVLFEVFYTINPADTSFSDYSPEIENYPPYNGSTESGNTLDFWIVWQSQYGEDINDSNGVIVSTNGTSSIIFLTSDPSNGTHYFRFTAGSTGIAEINLTFGTTQYNTLNLTLIIQINDRSLEVDDVLSSHPSGWVWDRADFLRYGDTFYFFVYIKDSQNSSSIDISDFTGNLPINVTFENVTNGYHLFSYEALYVGTTSALTIQFEKTNYGSALYTITFIIIQADSEVVLAPVSVNTYWTQDTNFSVIWQSIPFTQPNVTNQVLRINSSTISTNDTRVIFQSPSINGNYTFLIDASTVGIFTVRLNLQSSQFVNQIYELQIEILPVPTYFGGLTSPSNNSVIGELTPLYFSKTYNFTIQWFDTFNNSGIVDSVAIVSGSGMNYISTTYLTFTNGNHTFIYHANATGTFQIFIHLENSTFAESVFNISFIVTTMPTNALIPDNIDSDEPILVETTLYLNGSGYETFDNDSILTLDVISLWMNGSSVPGANFDFLASNNQFWINFSTVDYQWGSYNLTIRLETTGYQIQSTSINITLQGREIRVTLDIPQGNIIWGDDVDIIALLEYINAQTAGIGSSINLASLEGVDVSFRVIIEYKNGSTSTFEDEIQTDASHEATFTITGQNTQSAVRFTEISVLIASSFSGLPVSFSMLPNNFPPIQPPTFQQFIDLIFFLLPFLIVGLVIFTVSVTVYRYRRRKKVRILTESRVVEQSFEDIKSIRLILARHESGLQFYSESTIADLATDTDALSGMSAAISSFMEEVSGSMASRSGEVKTREIEMMSREGLHMLIWHGTHSSLIIISEVRLPDYFQERLKKLGNTLEKKYEAELLNFYSSDQIPSSVVKKMVRNFIPLHYFSAFILNEGVLTLESIKLSGKERKMLKYMKEIQFVKEGIQFFFSEQIISQLSKKWKRSEAIKFLNKSIDLNLLIEASQEDLLDLQK